jgi:hypothetical protein
MSPRHLILPGVCALALVLRVIGLQYGLPAVYNPDEVSIMARALSFAKGTLNPHNFLYPTFYFYVLFAWVGAYLGVLWLSGRVVSATALQELYFRDPTGIYTAGRTLGVAAGTVSVWLLYRLGMRLADGRTAVAAAVFLAVSPLHVRDSHYVKHDVPATLAIVAAYLAITRVWSGADRATGTREPGLRDAALAGAAAGVAFSTHYYCIFLALPLAWAIFHRFRGAGPRALSRLLGTAAGASAIVFFALSPFLLVEPATALRDITANREIVVDRAVATGAFGPAASYAEMVWRDSLGIPAVLLAMVGITWMLVVDRATAILLLAFPAPFLLFITNTAPASRYLNPVLPFLALFAAYGLVRLSTRAGAPPVVFWGALLAAAAPPALASVRTDRFFRQDDTRTLARAYIESRIPSGSGILLQPYSVPLTMSRQALEEALTYHLGSSRVASTKFQLQLRLDPYPEPSYRLVYLGTGGLDVDRKYISLEEVSRPDGLNVIRRLGIAFVVLKRYNRADRDVAEFATLLSREARRVATFSPYRVAVSDAERERTAPFLHNTDSRIEEALERPGPPLEIWQLDTAGPAVPGPPGDSR